MYANVAIVVWVEAPSVLDYKFVSLYLSWLGRIVFFILIYALCIDQFVCWKTKPQRKDKNI